MYYKFTKNGTHFFEKHASLEAAQTRANELGGYTVEEAPQIQDPIKTAEQKVLEGIEFGKALYLQFLTDNQTLAENGVGTFSPALSVAMLDSFRYIKELLLAGSILQAKELLLLAQTDPAIFTQDRKDSYLAQMDSFLNNQ